MQSPLLTVNESGSVIKLEELLSSNTVILDCRFSLADPSLGEKQYRQGHIPGAYYFSLNRHLSSPVAEHGGRHPLPAAEQFAHDLRATGITPNSTVLVYDDSKFGFAARAWWLLRYFGHKDVKILNGGFSAWLSASLPIDSHEPLVQQGSFEPLKHSHWTVDIQQVKNIAAGLDKSSVLIDSREEKRFQGLEEPIDPKAGHIPGALNFPWQQVSDERDQALSRLAHIQRWEDLPSDKEVVVYCGSGVTACVNLLSLAIAGREAKLYPGSWSDWCSYDTLPVETSL